MDFKTRILTFAALPVKNVGFAGNSLVELARVEFAVKDNKMPPAGSHYCSICGVMLMDPISKSNKNGPTAFPLSKRRLTFELGFVAIGFINFTHNKSDSQVVLV